MSPFRRQISIVGGLVVLILLVALNTALTHRQLRAQVRVRAALAQSRDIKFAIAQVLSTMKDAETGERGFLLTGSPDYLDPYNDAVDQVHLQFQQLADLVRDMPENAARVEQLRKLSQRKLGELAATIDMAKSGRDEEARELVAASAGKQTMDEIRALADQLNDDAVARQAQMQAEYERRVNRTLLSIYGTSVALTIALCVAGFFLLRSLNQREQYNMAIHEREQWFRVTLGSIGDGVIATDREGRVTFVNGVAENLIGASANELLNQPVTSAFPIFNELTNAMTENPVSKVLATGEIVALANHTVLKHRDGRLIPIEDSAAPIRDDRNQIIGVVLVFRDASAERKSQEMVRRAEKLAAAGRLASTMAHEINNPLEAVGNLIFIAKNIPNTPAENLDMLEQAEQQLERVAHLTRQTLGFYRETSQPKDVSIASIVDSVLKLYENKLRSKNVEVSADCQECPEIRGIPGELRQMISNLVSNAIDALPKNGRLQISASPAAYKNGVAGIRIDVVDNGGGISRENMERIFEPFFTTKADVGTGLGLWVTKALIERHGGELEVQSVTEGPDHGTRFTVFLPHAISAEAASASKLA